MARKSTSKPKTTKRKITRSVGVKATGRVLRKKHVRAHTASPSRLPMMLMLIGSVMMSFWAVHRFFYYRSLFLSRIQANLIVAQEQKQAPLPVHIFIPWNTDVDIEPLAFTNGQWKISDTKATYLLGSARPGEAGNIIIYGHNRKEIVGNIRALKGGEKVTIKTNDGAEHSYVVDQVFEVEPYDVSLLAPTTKEILTIYTCSGLLDSLRFIVRAVPME